LQSSSISHALARGHAPRQYLFFLALPDLSVLRKKRRAAAPVEKLLGLFFSYAASADCAVNVGAPPLLARGKSFLFPPVYPDGVWPSLRITARSGALDGNGRLSIPRCINTRLGRSRRPRFWNSYSMTAGSKRTYTFFVFPTPCLFLSRGSFF